MIFITVGTQLPFDRLISAIDNIFESNKQQVLAQIGPTQLIPKNIEYTDFIKPTDIEGIYKKATLIVAHAGMGSILTALKYQKPIVVMPRRAEFKEHRNDHQIATAEWVKGLNGVTVAKDEIELKSLLKNQNINEGVEKISPFADDTFIRYLKDEIDF